ncbi:tetratricopeptide repeat protein [Janthinobacterium sp. UMAB-56]|uniref:tetratricopeptide repeat protein n=1 Tax=Janthinobacterium sp. UMAB-56 TaxID=1365361 RepID=UPI001C55E3DB|nr:tetratricopeptide repeat protein [Janthinobacterium sp. UMAB-56]
MKNHTISLLCAVSLLAACAAPATLTTSNAQHDACNAAELKGQFGEAELACVQALHSAEQAGASADVLSQRQYNLGRIKRLQGKNAEAEQLYRQALATEEAAQPRSDARVGRRLVELASALAAQGKWQEGTGYLERVLPLLPKLSPASRTYSAQVLRQYAKQLQVGPQAALGARFDVVAASLQ